MAEVAEIPVFAQEPPHDEAPPGDSSYSNVPPGDDYPSAIDPSSAYVVNGADDAGAAAEVARARAAALAAQFAANHSSDDQDGKRKFESGYEEDPAAKRSHGEAPVMPFFGGEQSDTMQVPSGKVGKIIGKGGVTIKDISARGGGKIKIDHETPGETKTVTISGTQDQIRMTKQLIQDAIDSTEFSGAGNAFGGQGGYGAPGTGGGAETRKVTCPPHIVGRIIGRGGETIRSLQTASTAHIVINQDFPEGHPREVLISGTPDAVNRAHEMVNELINSEGAASTQTVIQKFGQGVSKVIECPKHMVGRIIGKGGETVKGLQRQYAASIQIEQNVVPCKVTLTGPAHAVASLERAVMELIEDRPMGGPGGFGGSRPPFQQSFPAAPYGAFPAPGYGGYGAPAAYGGYPAPGFGGYPGYGAPQVPQAFGGYGGYPNADPYAAAAAGAYGGGGAAAAGGYPGQQQQQQQQQQAQQPQQQQQQPAASAGGVWSEMKDDQGRSYYYNSQTGVSQWERPAEMH